MIPLSLAQIARITGATLDAVPDAGALVGGPVVIDSREVQPGSLFAALPGERADGQIGGVRPGRNGSGSGAGAVVGVRGPF